MKALNRFVVLFAVVAAASFVTRAQAADDNYTWEISGGSNANYTHTNNAGTGSHSFAVTTGLDYFFAPQYELGGTVNFATASLGDQTFKQFQLLVGPTFNFMGSPENSFFFTAQAGVLMFGNGDFAPNATTFSYLVGIGKRIEITKHVTWKPEVAFTGNTKATDSTTGSVTPSANSFEVIPFQLSVLF